MGKWDFEGKVVVVTGAASGIGKAVSREFGRKGAKLGLLDADARCLEECGRELTSEGMDIIAVTCDVACEDDCLSAIDAVISRFGCIDVLVNNAGITQRSAFADTKTAVYRRVMDVNFFGSVHCTRAAMGSLSERKGMIIVIESLAGVSPLLGRTGYCASKHALHGFFTSLRSELRPLGVHVMIVCPGFVRTNLQTRALGGDGRVTDHPQSRVGRQCSPEEVSKAIYEAAIKRKNMVILSALGKTAYWLSRLFPDLYERIMTVKFKGELVR